MLSRFGLFFRNRRDEEVDNTDEEVEFLKPEEIKSYPYMLIIKTLFYAIIGGAFVSLFFIFFILRPDNHEIPEVTTFKEFSKTSVGGNNNTLSSEMIFPLTKGIDLHPDQCSQEWSTEQLVGRCFGLKSHTDYAPFKDIHYVDSSQHCRQLCCRLNEQCQTWQYWIDSKICKLGGLVRIGTENNDSPNWCDPEPPVVWSGRYVERKNNVNTEAVGPVLTTQCFGLGPVDHEAVTMDACSKKCIELQDCKIWQWHEKRGCYYSSSSQIYCDPYKGSFDGGRKKISK